MCLSHEHFMEMAVEQAIRAGRMDEVPIGAVMVDAHQNVIARDHNRTISRCDPSAHAEMNVIRAAAARIHNYRLLNTTLYVTVEPCAMCMGTILHARIKTLVYGAPDPKWGAAESLYQLGNDTRLNHQVEIVHGICSHRCSSVIQEFFRHLRETKSKA